MTDQTGNLNTASPDPVRPAKRAPAEQERLLSLYYAELRSIAGRILSGDRNHPLQPTELTHEAALRLMRLERMTWNDVTHFLATAALIMRQVLLDEVRRARAKKRDAPPVLTLWPGEEFHAAQTPTAGTVLDIELLDSALTRLAAISPERAQVVELRFYAGLSMEEIAKITELSERTIKRQWRAARAWLLGELTGT